LEYNGLTDMLRAFGFILCGITAVGVVPPTQQPAFRSIVQTVVIHSTVKDESGRLVRNLTQDLFEVFDNGKPVTITTFSNAPQPITVVLLLDMSASMMPRLIRVRDSTLHFIDALLPEDRARIGSFGAEIAISPILSGDRAELTRIAREELWPGGGTPLWNAMYAGMESLADEPGRRVVLVLTDGMDSGRLGGWKGSADDVRNRATREGFMLYSIGMEGLFQEAAARRKFIELIDDTGGGHFDVGEADDLRSTFARVAEELRQQYLIGFAPETVDGKQHRLEVRLKKPGLRARARTSYVAERPSTSSGRPESSKGSR
jgi:Ca-activated chloride channel family protein